MTKKLNCHLWIILMTQLAFEVSTDCGTKEQNSLVEQRFTLTGQRLSPLPNREENYNIFTESWGRWIFLIDWWYGTKHCTQFLLHCPKVKKNSWQILSAYLYVHKRNKSNVYYQQVYVYIASKHADLANYGVILFTNLEFR